MMARALSRRLSYAMRTGLLGWFGAFYLGLACISSSETTIEGKGSPGNDIPLAEVKFAVEWEEGIRVYTGKGRLFLELNPIRDDSRRIQFLHDELYSVAYTAGSVDPSGDELAAVRCHDVALYSLHQWPPGDRFVGNCELIKVSLLTRQVRILLASEDGRLMGSCAWSPDANRIAVFVGRDLLILRTQTGEVIRRVPEVKDAARPEVSDAIQWDKTGERLYVLARPPLRAGAGDSPREDLAVLDTTTGSFQWLGFGQISWMAHSTNEPWAMKEALQGLSADLQTDKREKLSAVQAIAGSVEHPVSRLSWSRDRRYFFYVVTGQGLFSKTWIEGYDLERDRSFHVKTLERKIYSE
jgi:hypothetical protein